MDKLQNYSLVLKVERTVLVSVVGATCVATVVTGSRQIHAQRSRRLRFAFENITGGH